MTATMLPVAILAGGVATRLMPLTASLPKALVDVDGEPFIAHQLRSLRRAGIERVVVCAGHLGEMTQNYVGDGTAFGLRVDFSFDGPRLLGTAGALKKALFFLGDAFFVLYGDSYLRCDYGAVQEAFTRSGKAALMTVFRNDDRWDRSNVEFLGGRLLAYDKVNRTDRMHHIDYGLGVLARRALEGVSGEEPHDLAVLYQSLMAAGELAAFEVFDRFYEIGSLAGLEELRAHLAQRRTRGEEGIR